MAKPPETRDRFRIFAETSSEAMGPLLAQLTRMGLENIGYELVSDVHSFASRPRIEHGSSAEEFASEWIAEHPTFKVVDLTVHFAQNGRSPSTGHYIVRKMARDGKLTDLGSGNYRRADIREIAPPRGGRRGAGDKVTNRNLIWQSLGHRKKFTAAEITKLFAAEGRPRGSASALIGKMLNAREIKRVSPGEYAVIAKPDKSTIKKRRAANPVARYDVSNFDLVLEAISHRKRFKVAELAALFQDKGRNPKSVSPMITRLAKSGNIRQIEPGTYEVLKKAMPVKAGKNQKAEQSPANAPAVTETSND